MRNIERHGSRVTKVRNRRSLGASSAAIVTLLAFGLAGVSAAAESWTVVTVGRSSWGAATSRSLSEAIALAIRDCRARGDRSLDCGAEMKTQKTGYFLAVRCGAYRALVAGETKEAAESNLSDRLLQLRYISNARLGPCVRILDLQAPHSPLAPYPEANVAQFPG